MTMKRHFVSWISLGLVLVVGSGVAVDRHAIAAHAANKQRHDPERVIELLKAGRIKPLQRILEVTHQHVPGEVIEVELEFHKQHGWIYEVTVLADDGKVLEVKLDADTATVWKIENE